MYAVWDQVLAGITAKFVAISAVAAVCQLRSHCAKVSERLLCSTSNRVPGMQQCAEHALQSLLALLTQTGVLYC